VEIPSAGQKAAKPAPAAKPAAKKAAPVETDASSAKTTRRGRKKASVAGARPRGRVRGGRMGEKEKSNNMMLLIIGAASVIVIIVLGFALFGGDGEDQTTQEKPTDVVEEIIDTSDDEIIDPSDNMETTDTTEDKDATKEVVEEKPPEPIDPVLTFDILPPIAGCDQERFDHLTDCFKNGFIEQELPPRKRRKLRDEFEEAMKDGYDVLPVILNGYNGLDLLKLEDVVIAFNIAKLWNSFSANRYQSAVASRNSVEELEEKLDWNKKSIMSVVDIWVSKYANADAETQKVFFDRIEKSRKSEEAKAAKESSADDDE